MPPIGTMGIGTDGVTASIYQPPTVQVIARGSSVVYGQYQQTPAGNQVTLAGVYQFPSGSGQLQATGEVRYRLVTITTP